jgi:hypothetical protein
MLVETNRVALKRLLGRRPKLTKHQQAEALGRIAQCETLMEIARSYNLTHMKISRLGLLG